MPDTIGTARADEHLHRLYAEYSQLPVGVVTQCAQNHVAVVQAAWLAMPGRTWAEQTQAFYEHGENCLFELLGHATTRSARLAEYERTGDWRWMMSAGPRVLDFGAGLGMTSSLLREAGKQVSYVDIAAPAHEFARWYFAQSGLDDIHMSTAIQAEATYDVVLAENVLEYVADPVVIAERLGQALAPGGMMFVRIDNRLDTPAEPLRQQVKLDELLAGAPTLRAMELVRTSDDGRHAFRRNLP